MKQQERRCKECKEHFIVFVKRKLKFIEKFSGLPNSRHHVGAISNEQHIKLLNKKKEKKDEK